MPPLGPSRGGVTCGPVARAVHPQLSGLREGAGLPGQAKHRPPDLASSCPGEVLVLRRSVEKLTPPAGKPSVTVRFHQRGRAVIPARGRQMGAVRTRRGMGRFPNGQPTCYWSRPSNSCGRHGRRAALSRPGREFRAARLRSDRVAPGPSAPGHRPASPPRLSRRLPGSAAIDSGPTLPRSRRCSSPVRDIGTPRGGVRDGSLSAGHVGAECPQVPTAVQRRELTLPSSKVFTRIREPLSPHHRSIRR